MDDIQLGSRQAFPTLKPLIYLNHAAISPPSLPVQKAISSVVESYSRDGMQAVLHWVEQRENLRAKLANLIHAHPKEIGLSSNTTSGLIHIAHSIQWKKKDKIILFKGEFPTNITPWQQAANRCSGSIDYIDLNSFRRNIDQGLSQLEQLLKQGRRLLAVSAVQFQTGFAMPLREIGSLCKKYNCYFVVDAIQACGVVPIDVKKMNIDFLSCGSHKWLMGTEGCGFIYINKDYLEDLKPQTAGWLSHENGLGFLFDGPGHLKYNRPLQKTPSVFENGAMNAIGFAALEAGVDAILTLGVSTIYDHVQQYNDRLEDTLCELGYQSHRSVDSSFHSGILSFSHPNRVFTMAFVQLLEKKKLSCTTPDGYLRFSPHWPNSLDELPLIQSIFESLDDEESPTATT